jgi:glycosyltransferase involved in cell wall biosynthesis
LRRTRYSLWSNRLTGILLAALKSMRLSGSQEPTFDLVLVTSPGAHKGWILDAICREIGQRQASLKISYCASDQPLPASRKYFFSHYMYYFKHLSLVGMLQNRQCYVFATHLESSKHGTSDTVVAKLLNYSQGVLCMNIALQQDLFRLGVSPQKLHVIVGGADPNIFRPHLRDDNGLVGLCSAYYPRKSPELIIEIVRRMHWRKFILVGNGWEEYAKFDELLELSNFRYVEPEYKNYPEYYSKMTVFVSPSQLEGGPIPLLEAMMSNAVPVASRTGFAPDIISHGKNGFVFDLPGDADHLCKLIDLAFELECNVSETVQQYSWDAFSERAGAIMGLPSCKTQTP